MEEDQIINLDNAYIHHYMAGIQCKFYFVVCWHIVISYHPQFDGYALFNFFFWFL